LALATTMAIAMARKESLLGDQKREP